MIFFSPSISFKATIALSSGPIDVNFLCINSPILTLRTFWWLCKALRKSPSVKMPRSVSPSVIKIQPKRFLVSSNKASSSGVSLEHIGKASPVLIKSRTCIVNFLPMAPAGSASALCSLYARFTIYRAISIGTRLGHQWSIPGARSCHVDRSLIIFG